MKEFFFFGGGGLHLILTAKYTYLFIYVSTSSSSHYVSHTFYSHFQNFPEIFLYYHTLSSDYTIITK